MDRERRVCWERCFPAEARRRRHIPIITYHAKDAARWIIGPSWPLKARGTLGVHLNSPSPPRAHASCSRASHVRAPLRGAEVRASTSNRRSPPVELLT